LIIVNFFFVVVVGNTTANPIPPLPTKATIIDGGQDEHKFEWPPLNQLYKHVQKNYKYTPYILYIHDKGATQSIENQNVYDWIELLLFFNVHHWRAATQFLENYQIVCINFSLFNNIPHCSGNFWWARADYIKTLDAPQPNAERHRYEFWIASKLDIPHKTNEVCITWPESAPHYSETFPPEKYNNITNPQCMVTYPSCKNTRCRLPPNIDF